MDILYLLIPLSVVLVIAIGIVFWFALRGGQFDDLEGPALKVVLDDDRPRLAADVNPPALDPRQ
ncbi:MAG TPA: cbb3-type cytochrome oxidase assembly protein CcoS [Burkholderiales bacterium]|nr:cbb3-type cytochrome oxidase assembly protein CcoS [Burkholderiales bacterium]